MKKITRRPALAGLILAVCLAFSSCAALGDMASVLANLQHLKFKIGSVRDFRLLGLDVSGKSKLTDFAASDILKVAQSYSAKKLPVSFVMDVLAINPNDGTGGTTQTTSTLTGLECRLLIDGKPTIYGNIEKPVEIPGTGQESIIPLRLSLDLLEFFSDERYEDLVSMALAIGGRNGSPARLSLDAQPTVSTPYGPITYPGRVTIISTDFR
jgi:hypothetical protein